MTSTAPAALQHDVTVVDTAPRDRLAPWVERLYDEIVLPRRQAAAAHPFTAAVGAGEVDRDVLRAYVEGLFWHITRARGLFAAFFAKRPGEVDAFLAGRAEDGKPPEEQALRMRASLRALLESFGTDADAFERDLAGFRPPQEWWWHETQLRAAVFSDDLPWQVAAAAINAGTEGIVPWMCGPLSDALERGYGLSGQALEWLRYRISTDEVEHGDNGFLLLSHFVDAGDTALQGACALYLERLSLSTSRYLLDCGTRLSGGATTVG